VAGAGLGFFLGISALPYEEFFNTVPAAHLEFLRDLRTFERVRTACACTEGSTRRSHASRINRVTH
jgi:hypothetical protein